jgi:hypothetical protein
VLPDLSLGLASPPGEPILVAVKLQTPSWELNFRASPDELISLSTVRETDWADRRCLHVGQCAGSQVHWAADGDVVTVMVGDDDETWDVAVTVSLATVDKVVADVSAGRW